MSAPVQDHAYYNTAVKMSLIHRLSKRVRTGMYQQFVDGVAPGPSDRILDVGVSVASGHQSDESNMLEKEYPYPAQITMLGIHDGRFLEHLYPGTKYVQYRPGEAFPFPDRAFDVCYCHAVIEHVGSRAQQREFLREMLRVGRRLYLTTPNRYYPVELHKMVPFLHWLPQAWYRRLLRLIGDDFYSREENLNLLSRRELATLLEGRDIPFRIVRYRFLGFVSNFVLIV